MRLKYTSQSSHCNSGYIENMFYGLPNEFALRSRPKVGLPKNKAQNPVVENSVFPTLKLLCSGIPPYLEKPLIYNIYNLSVIFPIVSLSYLILYPMSFLGTQTQVYPPSHIADPHKGSPEDISTTKIHKISPSYWICLKEMYKTTHDEAL